MTGGTPLNTASQVLTAILEALAEKVTFVILRNYEQLPLSWGNDVDILVHPSDLLRAQQAVLSILQRSPRVKAASCLERLNFWSIRLPCDDRELQVDFYTGMAKAWITYAEAKTILDARTQKHPLFCTPAPLHELLLIAAKELFAYGSIRPRYHDRLSGNFSVVSSKESIFLFSDDLTVDGCRLVATSLLNPKVTGRPQVRRSLFFHPGEIVRWVRQRKSGWKSLLSMKSSTFV